MIIDQYGMIISGGDGGDSCHRMYGVFLKLNCLWIIKALENKFIPSPFDKMASPASTNTQLEVEPGIYIRNPDPTRWYSDPRNFSRDQMTPVICFHSVMANRADTKEKRAMHREILTRLLKANLKRYMFSQNIYDNWVDPRTQPVKKKTPDFIPPDLWATFARGYLRTIFAPISLPIMVFGDAFNVLSTLFKCFGPTDSDGKLRWQNPGDCDDENANNVHLAAQYTLATPFSWLARKIFKRFRPENYGNTQLGEKDHVMGALMWYHRTDNPEIAELSRKLVERY